MQFLNITDLPEVPLDGDVNSLYAWIIGTLLGLVVLIIPAIIVFYEKKTKNITERLNAVIDDSIKRMEQKNETDKNGLIRINEIVVKLKEIIILAGRDK